MRKITQTQSKTLTFDEIIQKNLTKITRTILKGGSNKTPPKQNTVVKQKTVRTCPKVKTKEARRINSKKKDCRRRAPSTLDADRETTEKRHCLLDSGALYGVLCESEWDGNMETSCDRSGCWLTSVRSGTTVRSSMMPRCRVYVEKYDQEFVLIWRVSKFLDQNFRFFVGFFLKGKVI